MSETDCASKNAGGGGLPSPQRQLRGFVKMDRHHAGSVSKSGVAMMPSWLYIYMYTYMCLKALKVRILQRSGIERLGVGYTARDVVSPSQKEQR